MNFDETMLNRLKSLEREVERLKVKESGGAWLDWTPTETGWTGLPTGVYRYCKVGKMVTCKVAMTSGASDSTVAQLSIPFTNSSSASAGTNGAAIDNATELTVATRWDIQPGEAIVNFFTNMSNGAWTASGSKRVYTTFIYEAA